VRARQKAALDVLTEIEDVCCGFTADPRVWQRTCTRTFHSELLAAIRNSLLLINAARLDDAIPLHLAHENRATAFAGVVRLLGRGPLPPVNRK
jgi:hypothetical protein